MAVTSLSMQELFDFARASSLSPGDTVTLYFTLPPRVAATVSATGVQELTPGTYRIRIGDVAGPHPNVGEGNDNRLWVDGFVDITGTGPIEMK